MSIEPKRKIDEISERLNSLLSNVIGQGKTLVDTDWMRLLKDLRALEEFPADRQQSLIGQAILWGLKLDVSKADACLNRAAEYGKSFEWYLKRGQILGMQGYFEPAKELASLEYPKDNIPVMLSLYAVLLQCGLFVTAAKVRDQIYKAGGEESLIREQFINSESLDLIVLLIERFNCTESDLSDRISAATRYFTMRFGLSTNFRVVASSAGITYECVVSGVSLEDRVAADWAVAEAVLNDFDDDFSELISFGVTALCQEDISMIEAVEDSDVDK